MEQITNTIETFVVTDTLPVEVRDFIYGNLYEPFGLAFEGPWQESVFQKGATYALARSPQNELLGTARLLPADDGKESKRSIGTVAASEKARNNGVGRSLITTLEDLARREGAHEIVLNARIPAVGFYLRLGYAIEGEEFLNPPSMLPHLKMRKSLMVAS